MVQRVRIRRKVAIVGQSNELGSGPAGSASWSVAGNPLRDPVKPNGIAGSCSIWPRLATLLAADGVWLDVHNSAVGATSLARHWIGQIQTHAVSTSFAVGDRVVGSGRLYKATASSGATPTVGTTGASAPTWPASGTVVDGEITWTYQRASTGADTAGKMFTEADAEFDPNGYIAAAYAGLSSAVGFDEKWMFLSIGQGDRSFLTPSADFQTAYERVCDYFTSRSVKAALGFTCYNAYPGADTHMQVLNAAAKAAMATRVNGTTVIRGANAYDALGSAIPLQADFVHTTRFGYYAWAQEWRDRLIAGGW